MVKKRQLTPEEKRLWKLITRQTKPLSVPVADDETEEEENKDTEIKSGKVKLRPAPIKTQAAPVKTKAATIKKQGDYSGIDKNTAESFRKGKEPIDAKLDLHGMTQEKAHNALIAFIEKQVKLESRRLLVITGKGSGILRSALPRWLTAPNLNKSILAFDVAKAKHGGDGAFYILLKRKRK
jgi:DNA-nicking Smr family endonuclease